MKYLRFLSKVSAMFHVKQHRTDLGRPRDEKSKRVDRSGVCRASEVKKLKKEVKKQKKRMFHVKHLKKTQNKRENVSQAPGRTIKRARKGRERS